MNIVLDILVVGIFAAAIIIGCTRGFVKSIMGLVSGIIALILALVFTPTLSGFVDDNIIHPALSQFVEDKIVSVSPSDSADEGVEEMMDEKPSAFREILDSFGVTFSELEAALTGKKEASAAVTETAETEAVTAETGSEKVEKGAVDSLLKKAAEFISSRCSGVISSVISFIVIYVVAIIILRIITLMLEGLIQIPALKTSDKVLGALMGVVTGAITCLFICTVVGKLLPYLANSDSPFLANVTADKTFLFKYFSGIENFKQLIGRFIK